MNEELGYRNVLLRNVTPYSDRSSSEKRKLFDLLQGIEGRTLSLGVWMPADFHTIPPHVEMAGRLSTGYFGWFVPKRLIQSNDLTTLNLYTIFKHPNTSAFKQFVFDDGMLNEYGATANDTFVPEQCIGKQQLCVTLLAAHRWQTQFVMEHINELKLYVKVKWLGANLQSAARHLYDQFSRNRSEFASRKFVMLHYSPSEVIDTEIEYDTIMMPACKDMVSSSETLCQYETMAVLKYYSSRLNGKNGVHNALREIDFSRDQEKWLLRRYHNYARGATNNVPLNDAKIAYDSVACEWLRQNKDVWSSWIPQLPQEIIYIGGIFPNTHESNRQHEGM